MNIKWPNLVQWLFILSLLFFSNIYAATQGPEFVKAALTAAGVYKAPAFEYTTKYDSTYTTTNGTIKGLFLEGLPYSKSINAEKRTKVFSWYGVPKGLTQGQKVPAVILIHGGGGDAIAAWVDEWIKRGYIAIAVSLINKLPDGTLESEYALPPHYDQLYLIFASGYKSPIDEDGIELINEDFNYYVDQISSTIQLVENITPIIPNKINIKEFTWIQNIQSATLYNSLGIQIEHFNNYTQFRNFIDHQKGIYFLQVNLKNNKSQAFKIMNK